MSVNVVFEQNYTIFRIYNKITIIACVFLIIHRISHCTQKNNGIFYSSFQDDKALLVRKFELSVTKIYPYNLKMNYSPNLGFVPSFRALLQLLWGFFFIQQRRPHDTVPLSVSQVSSSISPVSKRTRHPFYLASKITKERKNGKENCTFRKTVVTGVYVKWVMIDDS